MTDLERLTTALEFLKANQWTRGTARTETPTGYAYCAEGALRWSLFPNHMDAWLPDSEAAEMNALIRKLNVATKEITDYVHGELYEYNDARGTTKEDMVKVYEKAIEKEKASA